MADSTPAVARANNAFALAMYKELCKKQGDKNLFFSPLSITTALALTHLGTSGNTAQEIKAALNVKDVGDTDLHEAISALSQALNSKEDSECVLRLANRVYARKNYDIKAEYLAGTKKHYRAEAEVLDFAGDTEGARKVINSWVEQQTNKKIQDLLQPGVLSPLTAMVLVNAIYFKGQWLDAFDQRKTEKHEWISLNKEKSEVDMMFKDAKFKMGFSSELDHARWLEIPYKGGELSMIVMLPSTEKGLQKLQDQLNIDSLEKFTSEKNEMKIHCYLPKFKIETESSLKEILLSLGVKEAFTAGAADFSKMADDKQLYLSEVIHKAFVDVNEEGTEAAAATGMMINLMSLPVEFRAMFPFMFYIKHNPTGAILFMGRVMNPNQ